MYSRLYTHILNHYPQIDHCASFHHIYSDSSLFGLFASFVPAASGARGGNTPSQIIPYLVNQLSLMMYTPIPQEELNRAKNQLKSSLMMALESRAIEVEDLGRQVSFFIVSIYQILSNVTSDSRARSQDIGLGDDRRNRQSYRSRHQTCRRADIRA